MVHQITMKSYIQPEQNNFSAYPYFEMCDSNECFGYFPNNEMTIRIIKVSMFYFESVHFEESARMAYDQRE